MYVYNTSIIREIDNYNLLSKIFKLAILFREIREQQQRAFRTLSLLWKVIKDTGSLRLNNQEHKYSYTKNILRKHT